jgi:hypothetical protein
MDRTAFYVFFYSEPNVAYGPFLRRVDAEGYAAKHGGNGVTALSCNDIVYSRNTRNRIRVRGV